MTDEVTINYGADIEVNMRHNNKVEIDLGVPIFTGVEGNMNFFKPSIGRYFTNAINSTFVASTTASVANGQVLFPFLMGFDCLIDQFNVNVVAAAAGVNAKLGLYRSLADGRPDTLITESSTIIDCSTIGQKYAPTDAIVALSKGQIVWGSVRTSGAAVTMSAPQLYSCLSIDHATGVGTPNKSVRRTGVTFGSAPPSPWVWNDAEISSVTPQMLGLRIAG